MTRPSKQTSYNHAVIEEIIRQVCVEFEVSRAALIEVHAGRENLLQLIAICLARELLKASVDTISRTLSPHSKRTVITAPDRFKKYLKLIPGLKRKYGKLKTAVTKKAGGL